MNNIRGNINYYKKRYNHNGGRLLPFHITISTVLLAVTLLSSLLALYIGGHRGKSNPIILDYDVSEYIILYDVVLQCII